MASRLPIRVLIADDHDVVRRGLVTLMKMYDDLEVIGEARDGSEAVQMAAIMKPDVILMDLIMPNVDGVTATRAIHQSNPKIQIVIVTSVQDQTMIDAALQEGAFAQVAKNASVDYLVRAIHRAVTTPSATALNA